MCYNRLMSWTWEQAEWPELRWDETSLSHALKEARFQQGKLLGFAKTLDTTSTQQLNAQTLTDEAMTTSEIEGVLLERNSVRSSIATQLGLEQAGLAKAPDRYVEGLVEMMLDATQCYDHPLTLERLCGWHTALFPSGYSHLKKIRVGKLRGTGLMQIVSGYAGKEKVHFIAPPHSILKQQMELFFTALNQNDGTDGILRAGLFHLWFEILHPFDDGNGRIGRAIIDMLLAQDENSATRLYSISSEILTKRKEYYQVLENTSRGNGDITEWLIWFLGCFSAAIDQSFKAIDNIFFKTKFWQAHQQTELNLRQCKVLNKMLEKGPDNFEGGMTTKKYQHITRTSRATAQRELKDLVMKKCLRTLPGRGRSSAYELQTDIDF